MRNQGFHKMVERHTSKRLLGAAFALTLLLQSVTSAQVITEQPKLVYERLTSLRIPMRDGVRLSANVYIPQGRIVARPVILMRTPYDKNGENIGYFANLFTSNGYVLVVQDKRGRFESEGEYKPADREVSDSYDTLEWITKQSWSNGKVGAYGCSDPGDATIYAAVSGHPALKAIIPEAAGSTQLSAGGWFRPFGVRHGGAVELAMAVGWMVENGTKHFLRPPTSLDWNTFVKMRPYYKLNLQPPAVNYDQALSQLPVANIMDNLGLPGTDFRDLITRDLSDDYFSKSDFLEGNERVAVPALHVNSWYDFAPGITFWQRQFFEQQATNKSVRENQYLIMSPSLHCNSLRMTDNYVVGARPVGDPRIDLAGLYIRWFDHWLKGTENSVTEMPKIQYYMLGENRWRSTESWPPSGMEPLRLYLGGSQANGPHAAGTLTQIAAPRGTPPHRYTYDPANPTPSKGGSLCCIKSEALEGAYDQREVEQRADVLTYSTPPFSRPTWIAGPVSAVLTISSSAKDTDFTAKLVHVYPDGTAFNVQEGILRARYRDSFLKPKQLQSGEQYKVTINLQDIAEYFDVGHRLRLEVSSSNFPRFDRNLNTGGKNYDETTWLPADNVIYVDAGAPSYVQLYGATKAPK